MNNRKVQYIKTEIAEIQRDSLITEYSIFQSFPVILCISNKPIPSGGIQSSVIDTYYRKWWTRLKVHTFRCQSGQTNIVRINSNYK